MLSRIAFWGLMIVLVVGILMVLVGYGIATYLTVTGKAHL